MGSEDSLDWPEADVATNLCAPVAEYLPKSLRFARDGCQPCGHNYEMTGFSWSFFQGPGASAVRSTNRQLLARTASPGRRKTWPGKGPRRHRCLGGS